MSRSRQRTLSDDERILWDMVARSTEPLRGRGRPLPTEPPQATPPAEQNVGKSAARKADLQAPQPTAPPRPPALQVQHLDRLTQKKLARGRLPIDARIDLHGMRQDEAYGLLLSFLGRAHARGARYVLVITGKGSSLASDGVLKRSVPVWLATPPFRGLVSGYEDSGRGHGGGGALYVRLRRAPSERVS